MTKMNQKDATYSAITEVVGEFEGICQPTKEQRANINKILFDGFRLETIELSADKVYTDSELKNYVSGLISNWLRKDQRLNGGGKYVAKNPGSRAGSGDASIQAMKMLLATKTDAKERKEIQDFIDKRIAEIKPAPEQLSAEQIEKLKEMGLGHLVG
jgi:hypothetical protein